MCGIVGLWSRDINDIEANMSRMTETLHHRGPDDYGCISLLNKGVGLGHRRLAVIDLSKAGHQPMSDKNNSLFVVFNGEIYNFRKLRSNLQKLGHIFSTETDTEVLIEAYREWCVGCLDYFVGMFACISSYEDGPHGKLVLPLAVSGEIILATALAPLAGANLRDPLRLSMSITDASEDGGSVFEADLFCARLDKDAADHLSNNTSNANEEMQLIVLR